MTIEKEKQYYRWEIKQGKAKIKITLPKKNFETIYTFKNKSHNYYLFHCKKRPKYNSIAKFSIKDDKFYVTKIRSDSSLHNNINIWGLWK